MANETHFISLQQTANILNVSHAYLLKLIEEGTIPFGPVDSECFISILDILCYKQARDKYERQGLAELTRLSEEMGRYGD